MVVSSNPSTFLATSDSRQSRFRSSQMSRRWRSCSQFLKLWFPILVLALLTNCPLLGNLPFMDHKSQRSSEILVQSMFIILIAVNEVINFNYFWCCPSTHLIKDMAVNNTYLHEIIIRRKYSFCLFSVENKQNGKSFITMKP